MMTTDNEPIIADAEPGPIAWTRGSLSPDDGVVRLSDACLGELDAAVKTLKDNPMPTLAMRPEYFDLLACQATVADAREDASTWRWICDPRPLADGPLFP